MSRRKGAAAAEEEEMRKRGAGRLSAEHVPAEPGALLEEIRRMARSLGQVQLMEICGTHTMAIARAGLKSLLPENIRLISGPGCPVCVTPAGAVDELLRRRAQGADVRMVYSPIDALEMAGKHPDRQVVFAGVGFETTAPGTAACLMEARERRMSNFSVLSLLKTTEPAVRALVDAPQMRECRIDGFLCPGHVAVITGADSFAFLPEEYGLPAVVSGFEPEDLVVSVYLLVKMLAEGRPALVNEYARLVRGSGNPAARKAVDAVFAPGGSLWRGLGEISESGLAIREEFAAWDAARQYGFCPDAGAEAADCRCGDVIRGLLAPQECPLFGLACLPEDPVGPCMVSGEGACAAAYRYRE